MSVIPLPTGFEFGQVDWSLDVPAQRNRSLFTSRSKVVGLPGAEIWRATATVESIATELDERAWRAFLVRMRGIQNKVDVPVLDCQRPRAPYTSWLNIANTSTSGSIVTKVSGGSDWNARAISSGASTQSLAISATCNALGEIAIGLDPDPYGSTNYTAVAYCLVQSFGGALLVFRNGVYQGGGGRWRVGDRIAVERTTGLVRYTCNEQEIFSHAPDSAGQNLAGVVSLVYPGYSVTDLTLNEVAQVTAGTGNGYTALINHFPATGPILDEGQFLTFLLPNGHRRLVCLAEPLAANGSSEGAARFEPSLGLVPATGASVDLVRPSSRMSFVSTRQGWRTVDGVTSCELDFEEAL